MLSPMGDRVLAVRDPEIEESGGILLVGEKEKPTWGTVKAIGNAVTFPIEAGDRICFGKYSGTDVHLDDEQVVVLRQDEILLRERQ